MNEGKDGISASALHNLVVGPHGRRSSGGTRSSKKTIAPGAELGEVPSALRTAVRQPPSTGFVALTSRSHLDTASEAYLARWRVAERRAMGSSLKFCLIAEGKADLYPRIAPTREWDTAAGHAVLAAAGGDVLTPEGEPALRQCSRTIFTRRVHRCWRAPAWQAYAGSGVQTARAASIVFRLPAGSLSAWIKCQVTSPQSREACAGRALSRSHPTGRRDARRAC